MRCSLNLLLEQFLSLSEKSIDEGLGDFDDVLLVDLEVKGLHHLLHLGFDLDIDIVLDLSPDEVPKLVLPDLIIKVHLQVCLDLLDFFFSQLAVNNEGLLCFELCLQVEDRAFECLDPLFLGVVLKSQVSLDLLDYRFEIRSLSSLTLESVVSFITVLAPGSLFSLVTLGTSDARGTLQTIQIFCVN